VNLLQLSRHAGVVNFVIDEPARTLKNNSTEICEVTDRLIYS
jgi:hypothetical protein